MGEGFDVNRSGINSNETNVDIIKTKNCKMTGTDRICILWIKDLSSIQQFSNKFTRDGNDFIRL